MKDGFISVACGSPRIHLADCARNAEETFTLMRKAEKARLKFLISLPEAWIGRVINHMTSLSETLRQAEEALPPF